MIRIDDNIALEIVDDVHVEPIYKLASENRSYLGKWLPWVNIMQSAEFIKNFVAGSKKMAEDQAGFAYVIVYENVVVGRIGVYQIDRQNNIAAIGYWIAESFAGQGIVTRACAGLLNYSFNTLNLNRIEIKCGTGNERSRGIPDRLGFELEGIAREAELVNGAYIDLYCFSMLKRDWLQRLQS